MEDKCIVFNWAPISESKTAFYNVPDCDLNVNSAIDELDMLRKICPNGSDFLKEKTAQVKKKRSSSSLSSAPLCVVQMNSDFVTKFSLSKRPASSTDYESPDDESLKTDIVCKNKSKFKVKQKYMPYMKYCSKRLQCTEVAPQMKTVDSELLTALTEVVPPPYVTRQDSGNKSNPSSPVKSQNSSTSVGCSIFRSRSLDDLEISKLNLNEDCCDIASHGDIDTVSQRISKLQVS